MSFSMVASSCHVEFHVSFQWKLTNAEYSETVTYWGLNSMILLIYCIIASTLHNSQWLYVAYNNQRNVLMKWGLSLFLTKTTLSNIYIFRSWIIFNLWFTGILRCFSHVFLVSHVFPRLYLCIFPSPDTRCQIYSYLFHPICVAPLFRSD